MQTGSKILILYGLILAMLMLGLLAQQPVILSQARENLFDQYQRLKPRTYDADAPVRVIDIDEASLKEYGQWPWPRTYMAELTRRLYALDAAAVGFDILFAEPDRTSPEQIQKAWQRFSRAEITIDSSIDADHDHLFAQSLRLGPSVLAFSGGGNDAQVPVKAGISYTGDSPENALTRYSDVTNPLPELVEGATGLGSISLSQRQTSIVRKSPALVAVKDQIAPALTLELLRVAQGAGSYIARTTQASGEQAGGTNQMVDVRVGSLTIPLTADGQIRAYFAGQQKARTLSAGQILAGDQVNEALRNQISGRIILIGSSATGLFDIVTTPLAQQVAGVSVHAEILEQIVASQFLHRPDWAMGAEAVAVILAALLMIVVLVLQRPVLSLATALILIIGGLGISYFAFSNTLMLFDPLPAILLILLLYLPSTAVGFWLKEKARAAMNHQFAHFVPAPLIKKISSDPHTMLTPGGAERELTIIFLDVRQFSTLTERMSPEQVVGFVNDFLTPLSELIVKHHGTIDKFIGDAIMGFWNAPVELKGHPNHAAEMILAADKTLEAINQSNAQKNLPAINVGIGANTGMCAVGMMGSKSRLGYTCIGDAVNLASRLEGLTKLYGFNNCVGEAFVAQLDAEFITLELDLVAVKGRDTPERVFALIGKKSDPDGPELVKFSNQFDAMRAHYREQNWDEALAEIAKLGAYNTINQKTQKLRALYQERIEHLKKNPPTSDWQGIYIAREK